MFLKPEIWFAERIEEIAAAYVNQTGLGPIGRLDELVVVAENQGCLDERWVFCLPSLEPNPIVLVLQSQPDHLDPML